MHGPNSPNVWHDWIFFAIVGLPWLVGFAVLFLETRGSAPRRPLTRIPRPREVRSP